MRWLVEAVKCEASWIVMSTTSIVFDWIIPWISSGARRKLFAESLGRGKPRNVTQQSNTYGRKLESRFCSMNNSRLQQFSGRERRLQSKKAIENKRVQ